MLVTLTIRDFAIVDELTVEWSPGMTALTGETGAGKSILIDAVGALLGDKMGSDDVRAGARRAYIEGVFELGDPQRNAVAEALDELGIELDDGSLIVSREIAGASGGRSVSRLNGRAVPLATLGHVGQSLVDVHGQSEHLSLLRARDQLDLLDRFAGLTAERRAMAAAARDLREVRERITLSIAEVQAATREQDLLLFQVEEIHAAALQPDEEQSLQARRTRLRNVERLRSTAHAAWEAIAGGDEAPGGLSLVGGALRSAQDAARLDAAVEPHVASLVEAESQLEDVERGLRLYLDNLDADPAELDTLEERALLIADLKRKYGATVDDVLAYLEQARGRLDNIEHGEERLAELRASEGLHIDRAARLAAALATSRRRAALRLAEVIDAELNDLGLAGARFRVGFSWSTAADGLSVVLEGAEDQPLRYDGTGIDRVEFLFAANPGSDPRPLAQVASGGELARVSLAIKTALSAGDERATLIFDEVDVGVGGRTAAVVGRKLWELSRTHQVLCVTHLPQVAAYADSHVLVSKEEHDGRSQSRVQILDARSRVAELATMLAGPQPSRTAELNAQELLDRAQKIKSPGDARFDVTT